MRKFFVAVLVALFAGLGLTPAFAQIDLSAEAEVDITLEKNYEIEGIGDVELKSQAYLVGCKMQIGENLTLTPKVGLWNSEFEDDDYVLENSVGLTCGLDGEYRLFNFDPVTLFMIGSYRYADSEIDAVKIKALNLKLDNPLKTDIDVHSYEIGLKAAFDAPLNLTPYVGLVYSGSTINNSVDLSLVKIDADMEAKDNLGLRVGVSGSPIEDLVLGLEGRFLDEKAIVASVSYRF